MKCMKVNIEIDLDNSAFEDNFSLELREVLQQAADKIVRQHTSVAATFCTHDEPMHKLLDSNGNTVGRCYLLDKTDPVKIPDECIDTSEIPDRSVMTISPFVAHTSGKGFWSRAAKPVTITGMEIEEEYGCFVYFSTDDWDVKNDGLIYTDPLFIEELLAELKKQNINIKMDYSEQGLQGNDYVHFDVYEEKK